MRLIDNEGKRRHVKHALKRLRAMQQEMDAKQDRIAHLRSLREGVSSAIRERVSGGLRSDLSKTQQELEELEDEYTGDLARYASEIALGYRLCPTTDLPRHVCWMHWASGLTWRQVSARVGYSESHCKHSLCDIGVDGIYRDMPRRWREDAEDAI